MSVAKNIDLEAVKLVLDAMLENPPSKNADAVVSDLLGTSRALSQLAEKLKRNAPPDYAELPATDHMTRIAARLDELAKDLGPTVEHVRKIQNEQLPRAVVNLATKLGLDLENVPRPVIKLDDSLMNGQPIDLHIYKRRLKAYVESVDLTSDYAIHERETTVRVVFRAWEPRP